MVSVGEQIKLIWKNKRGLLSALCHLKEGVKLEEYVYRLLEIRHTNTIKEEITGRLGLIYSKSGKARSYSYDGLGNRIGFKEYEEDTYGTQGHLQPFGYTGYRYDNVADTYFAQAREYVPGVGRFAGEDWIKGEISYPTSLNQYGYCLIKISIVFMIMGELQLILAMGFQ